MNIQAINAFVNGAGTTGPAGQSAGQSPGQSRAAAAAPGAAGNGPREAQQRPPEQRPVLDLSDTALTRRDLPRGSLVDIIA